MKKIPKKQLEKLQTLCDNAASLSDQYAEKAQSARERVKNLIEALQKELDDHKEELEKSVLEVFEHVTTIVETMEDYLEARGEDWLNSRKGEAYAEWMEKWNQAIPSTEIDRAVLPTPEVECEFETEYVIDEIKYLINDYPEPPQ